VDRGASFDGFVFARGGSKGLPGKNLMPLGGKSLLGRAVETALASPRIRRVICSTDDEAIAREARRHGAQVPFMRPAELAADDTPELRAWQHALAWLAEHDPEGPGEYMLSVPAVAPLRLTADLEACMDALVSSGADLAFTVKPAEANPYFVMFTEDEDGLARHLLRNGPVPARRQDAPQVWQAVPVAFAARCAYIMETEVLFGGRLKAVPVPPERAVDIDTRMDLLWAEFLMNRAAEPSGQ